MTGPIHSRCIEDPFKTVRFQSLFILNAATQFDRVIERLPNLVNRAELPLRVVNSRLGATPIFKTASLIACHRILGARHWRPTFVSVLNRKGATTPSSRIQLHFDAERDTVLLSAKLACKSKNIISVNFITGMSPGKCGIVIHMAKNGNENELQISHRDGLNPPRHSNKPQDLAESICYESGLWNHFSTNCCTIAQSQGRGSPPPATSATTLFFNMYMPPLQSYKLFQNGKRSFVSTRVVTQGRLAANLHKPEEFFENLFHVTNKNLGNTVLPWFLFTY
ncbi:hypothetical protein F5878DRAFT_644243 [Lentinula raphanica]|uniref:Uncharacterized protein n=1 Tax=Lentinula raphanica TaxID=153919 RepID=A0AA38P3D0_9AGAR|nr:hypothetical protein F5878DRAFT_644243 [Lentinula raphanica]